MFSPVPDEVRSLPLGGVGNSDFGRESVLRLKGLGIKTAKNDRNRRYRGLGFINS